MDEQTRLIMAMLKIALQCNCAEMIMLSSERSFSKDDKSPYAAGCMTSVLSSPFRPKINLRAEP